ncbi:MAG: low molecular weight protein-tyrosine-phosphatase [Vicinamibacterales bacterium]
MAEPQTMAKRPRSLGARAVTALLTNPVTMALKRPLRDLAWSLRGAALNNPPLPDRVESVLFVCLGNICRSPFAAVLAARRLDDANLAGVRCASAGIRTTQGARPPENACDVAAAYGLSLSAHRPQTLTRDLVERHDLIVVMEAAQLEALRASYPDAARRLVLLSLLDGRAAKGYERYNIADPFSRPRADFEACYERIDRAVTSLVSRIRAQSAPHARNEA